MTPEETLSSVRAAVEAYLDPYLGETLGTARAVREVRATGPGFTAQVVLGFPTGGYAQELGAALERQLAAAGVAAPLTLELQSDICAHAVQRNLKPLGDIRNVVAVASGKGGVGKSTVAVNLALALKQKGHAVGLVDVDVYGPDVPLMMGTKGRPAMFDNKILPIEAHGIKIMSIGLLVDAREALVWRGPMIHSAVQQFLRDVNWGPLDYLVFDMPPGTGDAQLSLSQVIPLGGVVMVTTPQEVALLDVRKALAMFRKLNVPILGIVENMSYFLAPDTGARYAIFGEGGGDRVAEEFGVPLLTRIPLEMETRKGGDTGVPIVVGQPSSAQAAAFLALASNVIERLDAVSALKLPTIG